MPSPLDIITNAMFDLNKIGAGKSAPNGEDLTLALSHYNRLINRLAASPLFGSYMVNEAFTFSASQQSYSIGPAASGANFIMTAVGARPPRIERAKLVLTAGSPDSEIELPVITVEQYASVSVPALSTSGPSRLYYQPTFPTGTLWPVPYPTTTTDKIRLYWRSQLATVLIAAVATNIEMPPAYEDMLTTMMMLRLAVPFGKTVTDDMKDMARAARMAVIGINGADPVLIGTDLYGTGSGYSRAAFLARDF